MISIPPTYKLVIAAMSVAALLVGATKVYKNIYDAGYDAATVEANKKTQEAVDDAVKTAKADWKRSAESANKQLAKESRIREKNRVVAKNIPAAVADLNAECRDLGPAVQQLFNMAIETDDEPTGGGADTDESDDEVRILHSGRVGRGGRTAANAH